MNTPINNPSPSETTQSPRVDDTGFTDDDYDHEAVCFDSIANSLEVLAAVALSVCAAFKIPVKMPTDGE